MAEWTPKELVARYTAAETKYQEFASRHRTALQLACPNRSYDVDRGAKAEPDLQLMDSTVAGAVQRAIARIQGQMMPVGRVWSGIDRGEWLDDQLVARLAESGLVGDALEEEREAIGEEIDAALEKTVRRVFAALHAGGIDNAVPECFPDWFVNRGHLACYEGDDDRPLVLFALPASQVLIDAGRWGRIAGTFVRHKMAVRVIHETWPEVTLPEALQKALEKKPEEEHEVLEMYVLDSKTGVYDYRVLWRGDGGNRESATFLAEGTFSTCPIITFRMGSQAGSVEGYGRLQVVMEDGLTLNEMRRVIFEHAAMVVGGMFKGDPDSLLNPDGLIVEPGGLIETDDPRALERMEWGGRLDFGQLVVEDITARIHSILLVDDLPDPEGPVRSPTEIVARLERLARDAGPVVARLQSELVEPLIRRAVGILKRRGLLPELNLLEEFFGPLDVDGLFLKVSVTSPLAQADKLAEVRTVLEWLEMVQTHLGPAMMYASADAENIPERLADLYGVPEWAVRDRETREDLQKTAADAILGQLAAPEPGAPASPAPPELAMAA